MKIKKEKILENSTIIFLILIPFFSTLLVYLNNIIFKINIKIVINGSL